MRHPRFQMWLIVFWLVYVFLNNYLKIHYNNVYHKHKHISMV